MPDGKMSVHVGGPSDFARKKAIAYVIRQVKARHADHAGKGVTVKIRGARYEAGPINGGYYHVRYTYLRRASDATVRSRRARGGTFAHKMGFGGF